MDQDQDTDSSPHLGPVQDLCFSKICESGYYMATGCEQGRAVIRRGDTGESINIFEGHKACIWSVSLNSNATRLITGSDDKTVRLWDTLDGKLIQKYRQLKPVSCVTIDSESKRFLTGNLEADPIISLYDMEVLSKHPVIEFKSHTRGVRNVSFCHNDLSFVSSSYDHSILLWDCRNGKQSSSIMLPHHAKSLELCADGQTLTICYGESVIFLNVDRFEVLEHHKMPIKMVCASLHPEKRTFVACGSDFCVYKYDYVTGLLLDRFQAHSGNIRTIKYSPDGELYATCANKGDIAIWPQNNCQSSATEDSIEPNEDYEWDEYRGGGDNNEDENIEGENNEEENIEEELEESWDTAVEFSFVLGLENSEEDSSEQFDGDGYDDDDDDDDEEEELGEGEFDGDGYDEDDNAEEELDEGEFNGDGYDDDDNAEEELDEAEFGGDGYDEDHNEEEDLDEGLFSEEVNDEEAENAEIAETYDEEADNEYNIDQEESYEETGNADVDDDVNEVYYAFLMWNPVIVDPFPYVPQEEEMEEYGEWYEWDGYPDEFDY